MGKALKYGDHVDTDVIIPARYLTESSPEHLARHCMEDLDANFVSRVRPGDVVVAGVNFGCGSSREHAPLALKASGLSCVIAASFARIFYRNAINIGLPILESPEAANGIQDGDEVEIDFTKGEIINHTRGESYKTAPFPPFVQDIMAAGGLMASLKA